MTLYLKASRAPTLLLTAVLLGISAAALRNISLAIPVISPGGGPFGQLPFDLVIPLIFVIAIGSAQSREATPTTRSAARNHNALLISSSVILFGVLLAVHTGSSYLLYGDAGWDLARNSLLDLVLYLAASRLIGRRRAVIVPVAFDFASAIFGRQAGEVQVWALPLQPAGATDAGLWALVLFVVAIYLLAKPQPSAPA